MEIGPIGAVRPVPVIKPAGGAPDLSRVYEAEYLGESRDDEYTPDNGEAARGLEDDEDDGLAQTVDGEIQVQSASPAKRVDFFA